MSGTLIDSDKLKSRIAELFSNSNEIVIVSAYITAPAIQWLVSLNTDVKNVSIVGRLSPNDLSSGASDLGALKTILENGWTLKFLSNLHAKLYLFDYQKLFVGSANFTGNGLKLSGVGNLEAVIEMNAGEKDLDFIAHILNSATAITHDSLDMMAELIETVSWKSDFDELQFWPEHIFPGTDELFVSDFPLALPGENAEEYFSNPSLPFAIFYIYKRDLHSASAFFRKTKAFNWLLSELVYADDQQLYFGELTARLHDALADDPAPYRRDVKDLLSNLLAYIEHLDIESIKISRPRHSQLVKLL